MTASAKSSFDAESNDLRTFAADLIEFDTTLREYGGDTDEARRLLRAYTAAAIASTWPDEPTPAGDYPKNIGTQDSLQRLENVRLGDMLTAVGKQLRQLQAHDPLQQRALDDALTQYRRTVDARWKIIEEARRLNFSAFLDDADLLVVRDFSQLRIDCAAQCVGAGHDLAWSRVDCFRYLCDCRSGYAVHRADCRFQFSNERRARAPQAVTFF